MLTNDNFKSILKEENFSLILLCDGCANCTVMTPIVHELGEKYPQVHIHKVEVTEENKAINDHYEVTSAPTLLFLQSGMLVSKMKGYQPKEILDVFLECKLGEFDLATVRVQ